MSKQAVSFYKIANSATDLGALTFNAGTASSIYMGNGQDMELIADKALLCEYEQNMKYAGGSGLTLTNSPEYLILDRSYTATDNQTYLLDILQMEMSCYVLFDRSSSDLNNMCNYFSWDVTREMQSLADGDSISVYKGGCIPVNEDCTTSEGRTYGLCSVKITVRRSGNKYYGCMETAQFSRMTASQSIGASDTNTAQFTPMQCGVRNPKCRSILANNVLMIGPVTA